MLQLDSPWRIGSTPSAGAGRAGIQNSAPAVATTHDRRGDPKNAALSVALVQAVARPVALLRGSGQWLRLVRSALALWSRLLRA